MATLMDTNDAMQWAEEFCRIFAGRLIVQDASVNPNAQEDLIDAGTMVGWFANAMQIGEQFYRQGHVVTARIQDDGQIVIDGSLPEEILISREILLQMITRYNESLEP